MKVLSLDKLHHQNRGLDIETIEKSLRAATIFDKIRFSNISRDQIARKLKDLRERQVPERTVLLNMKDEDVVEYWFKNWLHPMLKGAIHKSPSDKRGCSQAVLQRDAKRDMLAFYENGQQNFTYTLKDVDDWLAVPVHKYRTWGYCGCGICQKGGACEFRGSRVVEMSDYEFSMLQRVEREHASKNAWFLPTERI